jgi:hypothetical protein
MSQDENLQSVFLANRWPGIITDTCLAAGPAELLPFGSQTRRQPVVRTESLFFFRERQAVRDVSECEIP